MSIILGRVLWNRAVLSRVNPNEANSGQVLAERVELSELGPSTTRAPVFPEFSPDRTVSPWREGVFLVAVFVLVVVAWFGA